MRYEEFKTYIKDIPIITNQYLHLTGLYNNNLRIQLRRWTKKGKIVKLRRGIYILNQEDRKLEPSRLFLSAELYRPSYVSLDYALSFYGLIPEKVADITCVSTKKTIHFENMFGKFTYQHVKRICFTGFIEQKDEAELPFFIATPEKAIVDFLYLNQRNINGDYKEILLESFRFQNLDTINKSKLISYSKLFSSKKLMRIIKGLLEI